MSERKDLTAKVEADSAAGEDIDVKEKLSERSFCTFVITQFLGAFNDNAFKQLMLLVAVDLAIEKDAAYYQPLALSLIHI